LKGEENVNWGAIGQGVAGTIQSGVGILQARKARKLRKKGEALMNEAWAKRTNFEIPDEAKQNFQEAQNQAYAKPELERAMEENANAGLSNNLSAVKRYATSSADALSLANNANQQFNQRMNEAAITGGQVRQQNQERMYDARNVLSDYRAMAWDMNVNVPFLQRLQWSQDLIGTGMSGEQAGMNQFVEGQNQIGESAANFFSMGGGAK
jgi:hypothetical protein